MIMQYINLLSNEDLTEKEREDQLLERILFDKMLDYEYIDNFKNDILKIIDRIK